MAEDARYRSKVYLETYLDNANLTKDDGGSEVTFIVAYADPDYPFIRVFIDENVDLIFIIDEPTSEPLIDGRQAPYGYREHVPITPFAIDKDGITGTKLKWKAEAEFRRLLEENPTGSLRQFDRRRNADKILGSTRIYGTEWVMIYERDTS